MADQVERKPKLAIDMLFSSGFRSDDDQKGYHDFAGNTVKFIILDNNSVSRRVEYTANLNEKSQAIFTKSLAEDSYKHTIYNYAWNGKYTTFVKKEPTKWTFRVTKANKSFDLSNDFAPAPAREVAPNTLEILPITKRTSVVLAPGEKINLKVSGKVKLGIFAGEGGPEGIDGFTQFNMVNDFRHGALLARVGSGQWTVVGTETTFVSPERGFLQLMINDAAHDDDEGVFTVVYNRLGASATKSTASPSTKPTTRTPYKVKPIPIPKEQQIKDL